MAVVATKKEKATNTFEKQLRIFSSLLFLLSLINALVFTLRLHESYIRLIFDITPTVAARITLYVKPALVGCGRIGLDYSNACTCGAVEC